jgi:hypothetical protein
MQDFSLPEKPMDFGETIDTSFRIFGKNFIYIMKVSILFMLPLIAIGVISMLKLSSLFDMMMQISMQSSEPTWSDMQNIFRFYGVFMAFSLISYIFMLAGKGAVAKAVESIIMGKELRAIDAIGFSLKKIFQIIVSAFVSSLMITVGFIFCFIPGIIIAVYVSFILNTIVLDDFGAFGAIDQSFRMMKKNFWQVLLIILVLSLLYQFVYEYSPFHGSSVYESHITVRL